jgi:molybdenum cofactor cytidylyltransferase
MSAAKRAIVGILLAAGEGSRFGGNKLMAPLTHAPAAVAQPGPDVPLGVRSARRLVEALPDSIGVVRPRDEPLAACLHDAGLQVIRCARADDGMGASLACGVAAARDAHGWVIALADMPWIDAATIAAVATALQAGAAIAAPMYRGERGHPVGFARSYGDVLAALSGDAGARSLIERDLARVTWIDVDDAGVLRDVDTREQLTAYDADAASVSRR